MNKKDEVFRECFCFSKQDLLKSFKKFTSFEVNILTPNTKALYEKFYVKLKETVIPTLTDSMWFYDYYVLNDAVVLEMSYCDEIELDNENELSSMSLSQTKTIFSIPCNYLSVEQYAEMHKVNISIVNRWLNRGEICTAKKDGENWLIPEIAQKPNESYPCNSFIVNKECSETTINKFPFLENASSIMIFKDEIDTFSKCKINYNGTDKTNNLTLNKKDMTALKFQLVCDPNIACDEYACILKPNFR